MAESAAGSTGRIFISYRRDESAYPAGWLYDRLADHCDGGQVFKDVDSIKLGDDFVEVITRAVGSCDVLLALIGESGSRSPMRRVGGALMIPMTLCAWRSRRPWRATFVSSPFWLMGPGCPLPKTGRPMSATASV
jgi:TIR domain